MNISPSIWGEAKWIYLFCDAATADTYEKRLVVKELLILFTKHSPCMKCSKNLILKMKKINIDDYMDSNKSLFQYIYILKEMVNRDLNKPLNAQPSLNYYWKKYGVETKENVCKITNLESTGNSRNINDYEGETYNLLGFRDKKSRNIKTGSFHKNYSRKHNNTYIKSHKDNIYLNYKKPYRKRNMFF